MSEFFKGILGSKPIKKIVKSFQKYAFGFRTGSKFHDAFDKNVDTSLKDATVASLKDTAKSTGSIYASKTMFSVAKLTFLESALGSALMSSTLVVSIRSFFMLVLTALSKTSLGILITTFSTTFTLIFGGLATAILTFFAGTQLGKLLSSTTIGGYFFQLCLKLVPIMAQVIPYIIGSIVLGYALKWRKKHLSKHKSEDDNKDISDPPPLDSSSEK